MGTLARARRDPRHRRRAVGHRPPADDDAKDNADGGSPQVPRYTPSVFGKRNVAIHFVGIGGIGMSGIAEVLLNLGYPVTRLGPARRAT